MRVALLVGWLGAGWRDLRQQTLLVVGLFDADEGCRKVGPERPVEPGREFRVNIGLPSQSKELRFQINSAVLRKKSFVIEESEC